MGFRFSKRIGGNKGFGWNVSGSGISSSYRSKYGSIGSKGFSIKTGIPGLSFRNSWGRGKNAGDAAILMLILLVVIGAGYLAVIIIYNVLTFLWWGIVELYHLFLRLYLKWRGNDVEQNNIQTPS